ncbi:MAG: CBS domain-containing protein [Gemmatimonadales bacterium]|nr:MAG: CBS domain-containing protein [Gemmatimonadales bacterium]
MSPRPGVPMPTGHSFSRSLATVESDGTVEEAALRMSRLGVDTLVVVDGDGTALGVITDRDLVVRCLALRLPPAETFVAEIMTSPVPRGIGLQFLELTLGRQAERENAAAAGEYESLPSLLALNDALRMVDMELAKRGGAPLEDSVGNGGMTRDDQARPADREREKERRGRSRPAAERASRAWE